MGLARAKIRHFLRHRLSAALALLVAAGAPDGRSAIVDHSHTRRVNPASRAGLFAPTARRQNRRDATETRLPLHEYSTRSGLMPPGGQRVFPKHGLPAIVVSRPALVKDRALEEVLLQGFAASGYYSPEQATALLDSNEGFRRGQLTYSRVERQSEDFALPPRVSAVMSLLSAQLALPGGAASSRPRVDETTRMSWQSFSPWGRDLSATHYDRRRFPFAWEIFRTWNGDAEPWTLNAMLDSLCMVALRELDAWGGGIDQGTFFLRTRRAPDEPGEGPGVREKLYAKRGFRRLGGEDQVPDENGTVVLFAPVSTILQTATLPSTRFFDHLDRGSYARRGILGHRDTEAVSRRTPRARYAIELYGENFGLGKSPIEIAVHDYALILNGHRTPSPSFFAGGGGLSFKFKGLDERDIWSRNHYVGIEGLDALARSADPARLARQIVVEISDRLALDHATPPKLTFTTNNKVLATALKAAGINSESYVISGPRMFPTPKVRRYAYVIRPELIAQWKTELITQGAPPMTGSGYFDFLNRMYAPLEK